MKLDLILDDITENCRAVKARIASRDVTRIYNEHLRPLDLRVTQLSVLVAIGKMREALPSEVGEALHLDRSTLSRTLDRLKSYGWLQEVAADDGRNRPVKLSSSGKSIIQRAHPLWVDAQQKAQETLEGVFIAEG